MSANPHARAAHGAGRHAAASQSASGAIKDDITANNPGANGHARANVNANAGDDASASIATPPPRIGGWRFPRNLTALRTPEDFESAARRYLPTAFFGFVSGGVEGERSVRRNRAIFDEYAFVSRILRDVSGRSMATSLFGKTYAAPFGIAPMGLSAVMGYRADLALARGAAATGIAMQVSAGGIIPLEDIHRHNPDAWYQAYFEPNEAHIAGVLDRVAAAGYRTLVVTVDVPVPGNRENNQRNGFSTPFRPSTRLAAQFLQRPRWLLETALQTVLRHGMPHFENTGASRGVPLLSRHAIRLMSGRDAMNWHLFESIRRQWRGHLLIKGVLHADDARMAVALGADGVIVSNHGGRQFDAMVSPLSVLPEIVAAVGATPVLVDSGFRRGSDILKAIAMGASMVFIGRPFCYAAALGGEAGVRHLAQLLTAEISRDLALLGADNPRVLREKGRLRHDVHATHGLID